MIRRLFTLVISIPLVTMVLAGCNSDKEPKVSGSPPSGSHTDRVNLNSGPSGLKTGKLQ